MARQLLADLGATVWKIERPFTGDDTRHWGPPHLDGTTESAYFLSANRGKHSICVDIATQAGADIVRSLVKKADVLIENYKVGDMKRYGLDFETLRLIKPDIVYCSITGYGQTGPMKTVAGYDMAIQAISGLMSITGEADDKPGGGPQKVGVPISDLLTGMYSATGVLSALLHRERTGEGQHIDMALLDVQLAALANQNLNYLTTGSRRADMETPIRTSCPIRCSNRATDHSCLRWGTTSSSGSSARRPGCKCSATTPVSPQTRIAWKTATL